MRIVKKHDIQGIKFYKLEDAQDRHFIAESIFAARTPSSRVIYDIIHQLEELIKERHGKIEHPDYLPYDRIESINEDYFLLREGDSFLKPVSLYLAENKPSLADITRWAVIIGEIGCEAERKNIEWSGLDLRSLWVDEDGELKFLDPDIVSLIGQYRGERNRVFTVEAFQPPEIFQQQGWDERARLYSYGVIIYYLVTGCLPFETEEKADLIDMILNSNPLEPRFRNHQLGEGLNLFIMELLTTDKDKRLSGWTEVVDRLKSLKNESRIEAAGDEIIKNRARASRIIKSKDRKWTIKVFWRNYWKPVAAFFLVFMGLLYISITGGGPDIITEATRPEEVVEYFYQAIDSKDITVMEETTRLELGQLEKIITQSYVMEKMRSAYSPDEGKLFGVEKLEIRAKQDFPQPVFSANYIFYLNIEEESKQIEMADIIKLGNVEGIWQIVELKGSINYIIRDQMDKLLESGQNIN